MIKDIFRRDTKRLVLGAFEVVEGFVVGEAKTNTEFFGVGVETN